MKNKIFIKNIKHNFFVFFVAILFLSTFIFSANKSIAADVTDDSGLTHCQYGNDDDGNCLTSSSSDNSKNTSTDTSGSSSSKTSTSSSDGVKFINPLTATTVEELVTNVLSAVQKIVGVLALVMLVIGALMYILSAGEEAAVERGKKTITMAIIGLAIAIAAPSILLELSTILGWSSTDSTITDATSFSTIAVNVLNFLLGIAGVLSIIMTVIGGIMYLTSAGDEGRIEKGKDIFKFSVIGIIIVLASMVIVRQIASFFSA